MSEDELLDAGAPDPRCPSAVLTTLYRVPDRLWIALGVCVVLVALIVTNAGQHSRRASPVAVKTPQATASGAAPATSDPRRDALDRVVYLAEFDGRLLNNIRSAATTPTCPASPIGDDPARSVATLLGTQLPGFTVVDSSVTTNADSFCGLDVRARDATGATVIVSVIAPPHGTGPAFDVERSSDRTTVRDVRVFSGGWQVDVGWVAQSGALASLPGLETVAHDSALRW